MTALAVAFVLCCAMVCGTVLAYTWMTTRSAARYYADKADRAALRADACHDTLRLVGERFSEVERVAKESKSEVESLRAQVALRSM